SPLDCPRAPLGCQATFRPPVGSATRANSSCALPRPSAPRGGAAVGTGAAALRPCDSFLSPPIPYGQNIRTCLPTGGHASTSTHTSTCLPLPSHPYSASRGMAKPEGGDDGLETPAGVYHGDRRSGTAGPQ